MTSTPHRLEGVSGSSETLNNLALARGTLDRAGLRRKDPELLPSLLKDPSTQVLELAAGRAEVVELGRDLALLLRSPIEQDTSRLGVFLGQDDGTAYVGVAPQPRTLILPEPAAYPTNKKPAQSEFLENRRKRPAGHLPLSRTDR